MNSEKNVDDNASSQHKFAASNVSGKSTNLLPMRSDGNFSTKLQPQDAGRVIDMSPQNIGDGSSGNLG